jgi:hypothetical protein
MLSKRSKYRPVPGAVRIVPEADGITGKGAHTSSPFSRAPAAGLVEHIHRHAQALALDLAAIDRQGRVAETKQETMSVPPEIDDRTGRP